MKLHNILSILFTSLLLCGNAFAKPDGTPPIEIDVNVVNTPLDVVVVGDTPLDVVVVGEQQSESVLLRFSETDNDFVGFKTLRFDKDWQLCIGSSDCEVVTTSSFVVPDGMQLRIHQVGFEGRELVDGTSTSVAGKITVVTADSFVFEFSVGHLVFTNSGLRIWENSTMVNIIAPAGAKIKGVVEFETFNAKQVSASMTVSGVLESVTE